MLSLSIMWISLIISSSGKNINIINNIKIIFNLNFSFDAILLIYINRISRPPISIRNIIIAIHDISIILETMHVEIKVKEININPIDIGVFKLGRIKEIIISIFINKSLIPANNLIKILVLEAINVGLTTLLKF